MSQPLRASVSFADELLILVDADDNEVGYADKLETHRGGGMLHRAFSIFLFDGPDRVLLQQRAGEKPLWPGYWSNSVCSHPRQGESYAYATERRLREELGTAAAELHRLYRFQYHEHYGDLGSEHELCTVYAGNWDRVTDINPHGEEIMAWDWFDCVAIDRWVSRTPEAFTPWFKMEWAMLRGRYQSTLSQKLS